MTKLFDQGLYMVVENPHQEDAGIELLVVTGMDLSINMVRFSLKTETPK